MSTNFEKLQNALEIYKSWPEHNKLEEAKKISENQNNNPDSDTTKLMDPVKKMYITNFKAKELDEQQKRQKRNSRNTESMEMEGNDGKKAKNTKKQAPGSSSK